MTTGSDDHEPAPPRPTKGRRAYLALREVVIIVVIALVASSLLRAYVVQAFYVPSGSMLPTIQLQDRILVSRIGNIERGEVVVFQDPGNW
ncbi:MAG: S26 family signal peptidase, partial [Nocardioidaceae bacterium]